MNIRFRYLIYILCVYILCNNKLNEFIYKRIVKTNNNGILASYSPESLVAYTPKGAGHRHSSGEPQPDRPESLDDSFKACYDLGQLIGQYVFLSLCFSILLALFLAFFFFFFINHNVGVQRPLSM